MIRVWLLVAALAFVSTGARAADPSALWNIVNGKCVPHEQAARDPSPCTAVDLSNGVAKGTVVLKDLNGIAQFLLMPTARIAGIEDPAILAPDAVNYWDAAWQARYYVEGRLHTPLPREDVSLAINSRLGRSQDQLHIHIDCVRADVRDAIAANLAHIGDTWARFPVALAGHEYRAIRINHATLDGINPFHVLADKDSKALTDMGMHTLVAIGATFPDGSAGFVLLDDQANLPLDRGSGEQLQDHTCAVAPKE